jgi:hypothetical protein
MAGIELVLDHHGVRVSRLLTDTLRDQALAARVLGRLEPELQHLQRRVREAYTAARQTPSERRPRASQTIARYRRGGGL